MFLSRIWVYPIKSLDGVAVESAILTAGGTLAHDRAWAIVDAAGRVVNAKRIAAIQRIRTAFRADFAAAEFWTEDDSRRHPFTFTDPAPLERWLGDFLGFPVRLTHDAETGFPDDLDAAGPTITSEASLDAVAQWFPETTLESVRRRFRSNLELAGGDAFAEDALPAAAPARFRIGDVQLIGRKFCQRCAVPTRDPWTGAAVDAGYQRRFIERRAATLPPWADRERFTHFYRFAINTSVPASESGKTLRLGDPLHATALA